MTSLGQVLSDIYDVPYVHLFANATTAIAASLNALGLKSVSIGLPNSVCPNVPIGILLSGNYPYFIDIDPLTLGVNLDILKSDVGNISCFINVHAYGIITNPERVADICIAGGVPVIQDLAVAQYSLHQRDNLLQYADVSILSFGIGKLINAGHGGAALTSNKSLSNQLSSLATQLTPQTQSSRNKTQELNSYHTSFYNTYYPTGLVERNTDLYISLVQSNMSGFYHSFDPSYSSFIINQLNSIDDIISDRFAKCDECRASLHPLCENGKIIMPDTPEGSLLWRFNILISQRDLVLRSLLKMSMPISSWYPSADIFFGFTRGGNPYYSDFIGETILNIWITSDVSHDYLDSVYRTLDLLLPESSTPSIPSYA